MSGCERRDARSAGHRDRAADRRRHRGARRAARRRARRGRPGGPHRAAGRGQDRARARPGPGPRRHRGRHVADVRDRPRAPAGARRRGAARARRRLPPRRPGRAGRPRPRHRPRRRPSSPWSGARGWPSGSPSSTCSSGSTAAPTTSAPPSSPACLTRTGNARVDGCACTRPGHRHARRHRRRRRADRRRVRPALGPGRPRRPQARRAAHAGDRRRLRRGRDRAAPTSPRSSPAPGRARSPVCGSAWSPPPRWATRSASPCTASARSTRSRTGSVAVVVVTDARRREVYWAAYDADGRRTHGPHVDAPAVLVERLPDVPAAAGSHAEVTGLPVVGPAAPTPVGLVAVAAAALRGGRRARAAGAALPAPPRRAGTRRAQAGDGVTVTVAFGPLLASDAPRCAELDRHPLPRRRPLVRAVVPRGAAGGLPLRRRPESTRSLVGYAGIGVAGDEAEVHTIGVDPAHQGRGIGRALLRDLLAVADAAHAAVFLEVRTDNEPAHALYASEGFTVVGLRKRYYAPSGADAHTMRRAATMTGLADDRARHRDVVRRDRRRHRPRRRPHHGAAGQRGRVLGRRARPLRRRGARGRLPGAPVGDGARRAPGDGDGRGHRPRRRRRRRDRGPRPLRRAARRPRRGQGLRHGVGRAALRREPPRRARRRRHPAERPAPALPRAARLRRALQPARRAGHRGPGHAARRDDRRRGGRGVRQGRPAARAAVPGRPAHRPGRPRRRPRGGRVPARAHRPAGRAVRLLLLRPQDRGRPARRGAANGRARRCRWPTSPRASRRPWSTCSPRRPCAPPASAGWTCCCSAAGWPPTRGCGRWPRSAAPPPGSPCACRGRACARTTGRWSPRWARTSSAAGAKPSPLDLPADSSLPVTQVLVG